MAFAIYYFKDKKLGRFHDGQEQCPIAQCPYLEDEDRWMEVKWDIKAIKKIDGPAFFPAKVLIYGDKLFVFIAS